MEKQKPFLPNILTSLDPTSARLLASRCRDCGRIGFPARPVCIFCHGRNLEEIQLGRRGRIHTFTICRMPVADLKAPYAIGYVDLPEGVRVFTRISGWEEKGLEIGMEMEMETGRLYEAEGEAVVAYQFHPVEGWRGDQPVAPTKDDDHA